MRFRALRVGLRGSFAVRFWMLTLPVFGMALIGFGLFLAVRAWTPRSYHLHMLTDANPTPAMMARRIALAASRHGLEIRLSDKPVTSLEALDLVDRPNPIDVALIPAGITEREYKNVRQVTALASTSLHLLVRPELADQGITGLRGKRVFLGQERSVTKGLARDVLNFAGLVRFDHGEVIGADYEGVEGTPEFWLRELDRIRDLDGDERTRALKALPDAIFVLSPLPSIGVREVVAVTGYRLVPIPFADAYCLDRVSPTAVGNVTIDRSIFSPTDIPPFAYGLDPPAPALPCRTLSTRLVMIAYAPTDPEAIARLLETIHDGPMTGLLAPQPLREQTPLFPFHRGTELYMKRDEPTLTPEMIEKLTKAAGGVGALVSGIVAFYGFLRIRQLRRFESYFWDLHRLELLARGREIDTEAPTNPKELQAYLEGLLLDLKSQAIRDFAEGGLKGEGLMAGIVSLANDIRKTIRTIGEESQRPQGTPT